MNVMNRKLKLLLGIMLITAGAAAQKPNIILLFSDDAGYYDFSFQGNKSFRTPNLDRLAAEGVQLKQAYVTASVCGPSRAGLLTGIYQQRFGYEENNVPGFMSPSSKLLGDEMGLPTHLKTIADYLGPLGYSSIILGKWHLGIANRYHPLKRGFDEFYGFRGGARSYWPLTQKEAHDVPENRMERGFGVYDEPEKYLTDAIADAACDFMERHKGNPFFMYVSFNAVHGPMHATEEDLDKVQGFDGLSKERKILAAMTIALDRACGQILDRLDELGLDENTLVVFANDNGGSFATYACNYPLSGGKANYFEGGIRVPCIMKLPGVIRAETEYHEPVSMLDLLPTFVNAAGGDASKIEGLDGVDLLPYLTGKDKSDPHDILYWKHENRGTIRMGDWKLMRFPDRPALLFNLAEDQAEDYDLAAQYPDKVREMYKLLFQWEGELERPLWLLRHSYEISAVNQPDEIRKPYFNVKE